MEFKIIGTQVPQANTYDNVGAHHMVKLMMQKGENLSIQFKTTKDNYPYAWVESRGVAGFKYLLKPEALTWLYNYLTEGKIEDFGITPAEVEPFKEDEDNNIQVKVLKELVESGRRVQFTPLFRETNNYISAISNFLHGKIFFRVERTEELLDYLREKDVLI